MMFLRSEELSTQQKHHGSTQNGKTQQSVVMVKQPRVNIICRQGKAFDT